jgi:hypothetical protein
MEVAMKTGFDFIQRMQEDAEFRQKVNAYPQGEERLAFLRSEGYDFRPFVRILDNLSGNRQPIDWRQEPEGGAAPRKATAGFFGLFHKIFGAGKPSRPGW